MHSRIPGDARQDVELAAKTRLLSLSFGIWWINLEGNGFLLPSASMPLDSSFRIEVGFDFFDFFFCLGRRLLN